MILTVIFFCACNNSPFDHATKTVKVKGTIKLELSNAEYPIDVAINGKVKLINGVYEEQAAPGSATKIKVSLSKHQSHGDLNGNSKEDDAIFLIADPGGSGTFCFLSAVIFENGNPNSRYDFHQRSSDHQSD